MTYAEGVVLAEVRRASGRYCLLELAEACGLDLEAAHRATVALAARGLIACPYLPEARDRRWVSRTG